MNRQLKSFIAIAKAGSIARAAASLHITSTALLKQLNQLEGEIGISLFNRSHQGVSLTAAGKSFLEDSQFLIRFYDNAVNKANHVKLNQHETILRVGSSILTPAGYLAKYLGHPADINFTVVPTDSSLLSADVLLNNLGNHVDLIGDIFDDSLLGKYHCQAFKLANLPLQIACPPSSALAKKKTLKLNDLTGQTINTYYHRDNQYLRAVCAKLNQVNCHLKKWPVLTAEMFNEAVIHDELAITTEPWQELNPFMVCLSVNWELTIPYGILYNHVSAPKIRPLLATL